MKKDKNMKNIKKIIGKNISNEKKQRYKEARDKCGKYKYCNMTDEQKQKEKDRQKKKKRNIKKRVMNKRK